MLTYFNKIVHPKKKTKKSKKKFGINLGNSYLENMIQGYPQRMRL